MGAVTSKRSSQARWPAPRVRLALSRYLRETRLAVRRPVRLATLRAPNIFVPSRS